MTLGSPVGSPTAGRASPPQSPYSPTFLIRNEFTSPQLNNSYNQSFTQKEQTLPQPSFMSNKVLHYNLNEHQKQLPTITKTGGPPTATLDSLEAGSTIISNTATPLKLKTLNQSTTLNNTSFGTPIGTSSLDSHNWVTIFGFSNTSQCQSLINQLGQLGNMVQIRHPPNKEIANWVHIKLSTAMEMKRLLSCNGKIYGNTMIGIVPCRDTSVLRDTTNINTPLNNTSFTGDGLTSPKGLSTSYWENTLNSTPLVHDPPMLFQENQNVVPEKLPSKDNGLVSKTLDYFFGW